MTIYNMTYVNQNQINYDGGSQGFFSLSNSGTSYIFTPYGGSSEYGTAQYSMSGNDGIYTLQDATFTRNGIDYIIRANGAFVRSLNNVLPSATGGTWTLEGGVPTMDIVTPIDNTGTVYNLSWDSHSASIVHSSGTFTFNITAKVYEFLPTGGGQIISGQATLVSYFNGVEIYTLNNHKGFVKHIGTYTTEDKGIWIYQGTLPLVVRDFNINMGMGEKYYEEDLTTGIKKYFAEAFSFNVDQFEMDGDRVIGIKQSFLDTIAVDLTHIVNTSITTATLQADNATINDTLTALGIDVTGLLTAKGLDVGVDGLTIKDAQGHKHQLHLGN